MRKDVWAKYNRDRHVKTQHEDKTFSNIVDESDNDAAIPTFVPQVDLQLENQTIDLITKKLLFTKSMTHH